MPLDHDTPEPIPPNQAGERVATFAANLSQAPHSYEFYQVMRLLEAMHADRPRFGRTVRPGDDAIRLAQEPSVTHTPASLAAYEPHSTQGDGRRDRLLVHFFGLFGTDGPLPLHLTEYARDRQRNHHDPTFARFVDLFHHRAISLFYRAWADVRPTVSFDRPEQDRFGAYVASLIGLGATSLRARDAMPDLTKLHFAGHLAGQTRHGEGLGKILSAFFDMPVHIEGFIGAWQSLPRSDVTRLGGGPATAALGRSALVGARIWTRQDKFRVVFGPLTLAQYQRLLPGGLSFHRLIPIVRTYAGDVLAWDVNLILQQPEVPPTHLGRAGRLGWTTWLMPRRASADARDLYLDASADSHASHIDRATPADPEHPPS